MNTPNHIAIIPDGNRRWAKHKGLKAWEGHREGVKRFWEIANAAPTLGVNFLSFWAASYDNFTKRSKLEIAFLVKLLALELAKPELLELCLKNKTRMRVVGEWRGFVKDKSLHSAISKLETQTSHFKGRGLTILFGYDGRREMLSAIKAVAKTGKTNEAGLRKHLWTGELPDVDLVIRTGGEPHWSAGFMMWLTANSQHYFTEKLWPAFNTSSFKTAIAEYGERHRRLGA